MYENPDSYTLRDVCTLCRSKNLPYTKNKHMLFIVFDHQEWRYQNDYYGIQDAMGDVKNFLEGESVDDQRCVS